MTAFASRVNADGLRIFPNFGVNGGEVIPAVTGLVSDQLASGVSLLIVSDGIIAESESLGIRASDQASLALNDAPDSPVAASTVMTNLWQQIRARCCTKENTAS